tara:strand:- start:46 stop:531 length:486 start_codon:yes stop_codon:yes gene_type:complete
MDQLKDYEGLYWINREGEIRNRNHTIIKPCQGHHEYLYVGLTKNRKRIKYKIHRLLAIQYIPNHYNKTQVDHIDRDRLNNSLDNLRWATASENAENRGMRSDCKTGIKNIHFAESASKWVFKITKNKITHKKKFNTMKEAIEYKTQYLSTTPCGPSSTVLM